jgi:hypothetical protein
LRIQEENRRNRDKKKLREILTEKKILYLFRELYKNLENNKYPIGNNFIKFEDDYNLDENLQFIVTKNYIVGRLYSDLIRREKENI